MHPHNTAAVMPMGKYKGQPVSALATTFLLWWLSQDAIRAKNPTTARVVMATLRDRLENVACIEAELLPIADGSDLV